MLMYIYSTLLLFRISQVVMMRNDLLTEEEYFRHFRDFLEVFPSRWRTFVAEWKSSGFSVGPFST